MVIRIKKVAKDLRIKTPDLITRPVGRRIYKKIKNLLGNITHNEVIVLDFDEIKVIDSSFVDELIVSIINDSIESRPEYFIKLKNISSIAEINIDSVFKSYSIYNKDRIAVITEDICQNNKFYIGQLEDVERDIIDYLRVNQAVNIEELERFTGLGPDEVATIMEALYTLRIVRHESDTVYRVI
ncbi:MAG: STAS-like domain-containing protein [bacterium]|nr:STAS-like domain-containing protein [bacterium]